MKMKVYRDSPDPKNANSSCWVGGESDPIYDMNEPIWLASGSWLSEKKLGGWFQIFFIFTPTWGNNPI